MTFKASKQGRNKAGYWKWNVRDPEEEKMMLAVDRHSFVKDFYENPLRYSKAFEMLVGILQEYGYGNSPERLGNVYSSVRGYYDILPKAAEDPEGRVPGSTHNKRGYLTWQENFEIYYSGIVAHLMETHRNLLPGEEPIPEEMAEEIRERILNEIPEEEFTKQPGLGTFAYNEDYKKELEPGDPLLMR
ncbi:MAG: hypothetical protein M2R46_05271 [Verrucomicrobia subdivision 3 bacterium]|nr:hypothetical protein [Limisphaerales bacterium]